MSVSPQPLQVPHWGAIPALVHGFFGRHGGESVAEFAALNLSSRTGDDPQRVRANWQRVSASIGASMHFRTMRQCHGAEVACVDDRAASAPEADGLLSRAAGIALCVLTADCVPVLLVAPEHRALAAVHAGWRGTVLGVVSRAVEGLANQFGVPPTAVRAALGPAIGACCYEVGSDIADEVERRWGAMPDAVARAGHKSRLDLRRINMRLLAAAGVPPAQITNVGPCTRCASGDYFSHRAAHAGRTGRQLSFIGWKA